MTTAPKALQRYVPITNGSPIASDIGDWYRVSDVEAELARLRRYAAPEAGAKALSWVKNPCKKHDQYWTTAFGACMACRAVDADDRLRNVEKAADGIVHAVNEGNFAAATRLIAAYDASKEQR